MQHLYLKNKCYTFEQLPSIPAILIELIDLCYDETGNFSQIAKVVQQDTALTGRVIQLANSPLYRQWKAVNDIRQMLIVLGLDNVRQIVVSSAVHQYFSSFNTDFEQTLQQIGFRSLLCSEVARRLAQLTGYQHPQEAFLAGLLFQIGQLLLLLQEGESYQRLLKDLAPETDLRAQEKELFEVDHCELGAALVESWQLESFISDAILFQSATIGELSNAPVLVKIIAVASALSSATPPPHSALERGGALFNLSENSLLECYSTGFERARQTCMELGWEPEDEKQLKHHLTATRKNLGNRIESLALANGSPAPTENLTSPLDNLRASFGNLLDVRNLLFWGISDEHGLKSMQPDGSRLLEELSFDREDPNSLLSKTFNTQTPLDTFTEQPSLLDRQLLRLLKTEGALFFPVSQQETQLGVVALGVTADQLETLQKRNLLIHILCENFANSLQKLLKGQETTAGISYAELSRLSHEISNPLTIIKNYLYVLSKKMDNQQDTQEDLEFINEEIDRIGNIMLRAKDPLSSQSDQTRLEINSLLRELDKVLSASLYKSATITSQLKLDDNIPNLRCSTDKVKQILINLLKNAAEALPKDGIIKISSRDAIYQNGEEYVEISIHDNGPGIPRHILQNLFKPVESTKPGHSGVGLSIVGNLAREISALVTCHSSTETGTEFTLLLPRTPLDQESR